MVKKSGTNMIWNCTKYGECEKEIDLPIFAVLGPAPLLFDLEVNISCIRDWTNQPIFWSKKSHNSIPTTNSIVLCRQNGKWHTIWGQRPIDSPWWNHRCTSDSEVELWGCLQRFHPIYWFIPVLFIHALTIYFRWTPVSRWLHEHCIGKVRGICEWNFEAKLWGCFCPRE